MAIGKSKSPRKTRKTPAKKPAEDPLAGAEDAEAARELSTASMKRNADAIEASCEVIRKRMRELQAQESHSEKDLKELAGHSSHLAWVDEKNGRVLDSVRKYDTARITALESLPTDGPERLDRMVTEYLLSIDATRQARILEAVNAAIVGPGGVLGN